MHTIGPLVPTAQSPADASTSRNETAREAMHAFETLFLSQVVDEMMKTVDIGQTMGDHAAEMWRSVISEALANNLMENGGFGIADNIQKKIDAYKVHAGGESGGS